MQLRADDFDCIPDGRVPDRVAATKYRDNSGWQRVTQPAGGARVTSARYERDGNPPPYRGRRTIQWL
jgi:hypothetical protein